MEKGWDFDVWPFLNWPPQGPRLGKAAPQHSKNIGRFLW